MIINKRKKGFKYLYAVGLAGALIVLIGTGAWLISSNNQNNGANNEAPVLDANDPGFIDTNPPSDDQKAAATKTKEDSIEKDNKSSTQTAPDSTNEKSKASVVITRANINGDVLNIGVLIESLVSNGTCNLTLSKGSVKIVETVGVQALSSSSTCKGFEIAKSKLSSGEWNISVSFNNQEFEGAASIKKLLEI